MNTRILRVCALQRCLTEAHNVNITVAPQAQEEGGWQGTILVADSVAQALARTHHVQVR